MKKFLYIIMFSIVVFSCKKQMEEASPVEYISKDYLANVKMFLKNNLSQNDFASVDFNHAALSEQTDCWYLRFGWQRRDRGKDFILLQTDSLGLSVKGKIIRLERDATSNQSNVFNGHISMETLNREPILSSRVTAGYVETSHPAMFAKVSVNSDQTATDLAMIVPVYYNDLPEVVVVGYIPSSGGISYSDYLFLSSLMNSGGVGGGSASSGSGGSSGGSGGSASGIYSPAGGGSGSGGAPNHNLLINYESSISKPGIDIRAYMKCFSSIPDADAQCSATIFTDLPVNNDPSEMFNWYTGAVGHCFLQLTKTNGSQSVTQIVGFNALKPFQALFANDPVGSKMVNNAGHKYNAYLNMQITPSQLNAEIQEIEFLSGDMPYSINNYNCVDFALQVLNTIRGVNPLVIPKYQIPGQPAGFSNTPQGLYKLLASMKAAGGPEANNILTGGVLHAGTSHGPCN